MPRQNMKQQAVIKSVQQAENMEQHGAFIMGLIPPKLIEDIHHEYPAGERIEINPISVSQSDQSNGAISYRKYMIWAHPPCDGDGPLRVPRFTSDGETIEENGYLYPNSGMWQGWYWSFEVAVAQHLGWKCDALEGSIWAQITNKISETYIKPHELTALLQAQSRMYSYYARNR